MGKVKNIHYKLNLETELVYLKPPGACYLVGGSLPKKHYFLFLERQNLILLEQVTVVNKNETFNVILSAVIMIYFLSVTWSHC